ncbi:DUF4381 family protein [Methylocella sp.]|uniref:DUF4381 family protein n=1 Tax=Methylocella sp. TaxID=1978226 RepID=UPI0037851AAE
MTELDDALAALRPIRLPADAGEPALLAAMALAGALAGLALAALAFLLVRRRAGPRRAALEALRRARALPAPERAGALARLAHRLARRLDPQAPREPGRAASLEPLDRALKTSFFTAGEGRALGEALYRRPPPAPSTLDEIERALERLIARVPAEALRGALR